MAELTLQLPKLTRQTLNIPIYSIGFWAEGGTLILDAPYQRELVWGRTRQRNLIKSLLTGVPVPAIVINDRLSVSGFTPPAGYSRSQAEGKAVVDGKQRITAVLAFINGELGIPASWYDATATEDAELFFGDLPLSQQRKFTNRTLPLIIAELPDLAAEQELFDLINFSGIAQGDSDPVE